MTLKKIKTKFSKDQEKHVHRQSFKGHRTRHHFLDAIKEKDADTDISTITKTPNPDVGESE